MEKAGFLPEKFRDLSGSEVVESSVQKALAEGQSGPKNKDERVGMHMDRIEKIIDSDSGFGKLKLQLLKKFTIDTADDAILAKIAEGLYKSEKRIALEQGRGADIARLESDGNVVERYKPLIKEKAVIQRKTLSSWLDYLQENDAMHPTWFRYFVVRSLAKMGTLDKEKGEYSKRTAYTVAAFPELNSEALGWVYTRLSRGIDPDEQAQAIERTQQQITDIQKQIAEPSLTTEDADRLRAQLFASERHLARWRDIKKTIQGKDFSTLYAFAQIETAGKLNRESFEGEWKKYDQGSDPAVLERDLKDKGTGWCTAEGSAASQLQAGDFYVYFTKVGDAYTQPRVAIRMESDRVAEVRGVNPRQELEPELVDIAQAQYRTLPGGDSYDKKASDMKKVTMLVHKQTNGLALTKDELIFLYEINGPIEGFGYEKDPRVKTLRDQRDPKVDAPFVLECSPKQIAWSQDEITEHTTAYIGPLFDGVFKLTNLEHLYTTFPEGQIRFQQLTIGRQTGAELEQELASKEFKFDGWAKSLLKQISGSKVQREVELVRLTVADLGFMNLTQYDEICKKAKQLGLELCPPEVGPLLRLALPNQPMGDWIKVAMQALRNSDGNPRIFDVAHGGGGRWLHATYGGHGRRWDPGDSFVFLRSKT